MKLDPHTQGEGQWAKKEEKEIPDSSEQIPVNGWTYPDIGEGLMSLSMQHSLCIPVCTTIVREKSEEAEAECRMKMSMKMSLL